MYLVAWGWCHELELLHPDFYGERGAFATYLRLREAGQDVRLTFGDDDGEYVDGRARSTGTGLTDLQQALIDHEP